MGLRVRLRLPVADPPALATQAEAEAPSLSGGTSPRRARGPSAPLALGPLSPKWAMPVTHGAGLKSAFNATARDSDLRLV